jgi:hypothetical protein
VSFIIKGWQERNKTFSVIVIMGGLADTRVSEIPGQVASGDGMGPLGEG